MTANPNEEKEVLAWIVEWAFSRSHTEMLAAIAKRQPLQSLTEQAPRPLICCARASLESKVDDWSHLEELTQHLEFIHRLQGGSVDGTAADGIVPWSDELRSILDQKLIKTLRFFKTKAAISCILNEDIAIQLAFQKRLYKPKETIDEKDALGQALQDDNKELGAQFRQYMIDYGKTKKLKKLKLWRKANKQENLGCAMEYLDTFEDTLPVPYLEELLSRGELQLSGMSNPTPESNPSVVHSAVSSTKAHARSELHSASKTDTADTNSSEKLSKRKANAASKGKRKRAKSSFEASV